MQQNYSSFKRFLVILLACSSLFSTAQPAFQQHAAQAAPQAAAIQGWLSQPQQPARGGILQSATTHLSFGLDQNTWLYQTMKASLPKGERIKFVSVNLESFDHYRGMNEAGPLQGHLRVNLPANQKMDDNQRIAAFKSFLNTVQPDICCLQEFDTGQENVATTGWAHRLKGSPEFSDYSIVHNLMGNLAILFNPNQLRFVCATHSTGRGGARLQAVLFEDIVTRQRFVVINNHAHFGKMADHQQPYKSIIAAAGQLPIIATGDWNCDLGNKNTTAQQGYAGNHNICVLQDLFAAKYGWREATAHIPHTARFPDWSDVFAKVDGIYTRGINHIMGVTSMPDTGKSHLLLSLSGHNPCGQKNDNEIVNEHRAFMSSPGHPGIVHPAMGAFDPKDDNGHFSDHAALFMAFSFTQPQLPTQAALGPEDADGTRNQAVSAPATTQQFRPVRELTEEEQVKLAMAQSMREAEEAARKTQQQSTGGSYGASGGGLPLPATRRTAAAQGSYVNPNDNDATATPRRQSQSGNTQPAPQRQAAPALPPAPAGTRWIQDAQGQFYLVNAAGSPVVPGYIDPATGASGDATLISTPGLYFYARDYRNVTGPTTQRGRIIPILRTSQPSSDAYAWDPQARKHRKYNFGRHAYYD